MKKLGVLIIMTLATVGVYAQTLTEGLRALDFEQYEKARGIFTTLIQNEPANGDNYYYLGQAQWNLFKSEEALKAYKAGITAAPNNPMNYAGWGELLLEEGKVEEAKEQFNRALSFSKGKDGKCKDINALRIVADAMVSSETKLTNSAAILVEEALELNRRDYDVLITTGDVYLEKDPGNAGPAASMYENAISLQKNNPKAYTRVSNIWLRVKNAEATKSALDRALEIDSNYAPALKNLAEYYSLSKQFAKAKETYERYLQNSEPSSANKTRWARILFRNKEYKAALYVILEVQKADTSDIYLYRLGGYSYYEVGVEEKDTSMFRPGIESLEHFMANIDSKKIISNDYEYLGKLYSKIKGNEDLAVANINKALEADPGKLELYKEAATIYNNIRQYDKACESFELYIAKSGRGSAADYFLMGKAAFFSKQYAKADSAFAKVNELKPDYAEAYYYRGNAIASLDPDFNTSEAKDMWDKYLSLTEPTPDKYKRNIVSTYSNLATYYIQKDNNNKAKEYYNKVLALDPENKDAKDKLKLLK